MQIEFLVDLFRVTKRNKQTEKNTTAHANEHSNTHPEMPSGTLQWEPCTARGLVHSITHSLQDLSSNTVGRGFVPATLAAHLRVAPPLSNPGTLTACKSAGIQ